MLKTLITLSFILLFVTTIALPTIVIIIDDTADISLFNDFSEEEEEKGSEKNNELELFHFELEQEEQIVFSRKIKTEVSYRFKAYSNPHLSFNSPPPDFTI